MIDHIAASRTDVSAARRSMTTRKAVRRVDGVAHEVRHVASGVSVTGPADSACARGRDRAGGVRSVGQLFRARHAREQWRNQKRQRGQPHERRST